tara:strand:+ start:104 stop:640 length:537 start_codon:yes stop_codon:yes gene_type:complete
MNQFDDIKFKLIDYVYNLQKQNPTGVDISNRGGWQSPTLNLSKDNDLLRNFLIECLSDIPFIEKQTSLQFDAWVNINKKGNHNIRHIHPTSNLSGVLWIKCPEKCGEIVFTSPYEFVGFKELESYSDKFKKENNAYISYRINPKEGYMILFPSHLAHRVNENKSDEDRISIAFNIKFD